MLNWISTGTRALFFLAYGGGVGGMEEDPPPVSMETNLRGKTPASSKTVRQRCEGSQTHKWRNVNKRTHLPGTAAFLPHIVSIPALEIHGVRTSSTNGIRNCAPLNMLFVFTLGREVGVLTLTAFMSQQSNSLLEEGLLTPANKLPSHPLNLPPLLGPRLSRIGKIIWLLPLLALFNPPLHLSVHPALASPSNHHPFTTL